MRNSLIARHLFHLLKGPGLIYIYPIAALLYISLISLNECIINSFLFFLSLSGLRPAFHSPSYNTIIPFSLLSV